jgi:hypothetical protein
MDLSACKSKADLAQTCCSVGCCANKRGLQAGLFLILAQIASAG